jgi:hypothetical protein
MQETFEVLAGAALLLHDLMLAFGAAAPKSLLDTAHVLHNLLLVTRELLGSC